MGSVPQLRLRSRDPASIEQAPRRSDCWRPIFWISMNTRLLMPKLSSFVQVIGALLKDSPCEGRVCCRGKRSISASWCAFGVCGHRVAHATGSGRYFDMSFTASGCAHIPMPRPNRTPEMTTAKAILPMGRSAEPASDAACIGWFSAYA